MKGMLCLIMLVLFSGGVMVGIGSGQPQATLDLGAYIWKHRLLLVFASSNEDGAYQELVKKLQGQEGEVVERDLLVFSIFERGQSRLGNSVIDPHSAASLRDKFSITPGQFTVVLVGKDGGEKLRRGAAVDIDEIFSVIDAMPMRQREMEEKKR